MKTKTIHLKKARGKFHTRKIIALAGMSCITFPKIWTENKEWLQAGKKVWLRLNADDTITIQPITHMKIRKLPKEIAAKLIGKIPKKGGEKVNE